MSSTPNSRSVALSSGWVVAPAWDLKWLSFSAVLVAMPPLAHTYWKVGATGVDLLVTLLIGGPHMYATFLRTVFEPRFRERHRLLAWGPVVLVPIGVVLASLWAFEALLSFFFIWASIHICDQASYIAGLYRARAGTPGRFDKLLDGLVALSALYVVAIYRFVDGSFVVGGHQIFFPAFLKRPWVAHAFAFGAAALIAAWAVRSWNQYRAGTLGRPYFVFMGLTVGVAFFVPMFRELSISFQGFNAWHSFQYVGLTFLALNRRETLGEVTLGFVKEMASPARFFRYYGWNVLLTTGAGLIIALLTWGLKLPLEQCYYTVVLSILLVHYFHDTVLFSAASEAIPASA